MRTKAKEIKLNRTLVTLTIVLLLQACAVAASGDIQETPTHPAPLTEQSVNTASPTITNIPGTQIVSQTPLPSFPTRTAISSPSATSAPSPTAPVAFPTETYNPLTPIPVTGGGPGSTDTPNPATATLPSGLPDSGGDQVQALSPSDLLESAEVEQRVAEINWPTRMRLGNTDWIRFSFKINEPEPETGTATLEITVETPDREMLQGASFDIPVPESHIITVDAKFNAIGLQISPQDSRQRLFRPGEDIEWIWIIQPENAGRHFVSFSLELIFSPIDGDSEPIKLSFDTQAVGIDVVTAFGLTGDHLKAIGYLGTISGAIGTLSQIQDQVTGFLKGIIPRPKKPAEDKGKKAKVKKKMDTP